MLINLFLMEQSITIFLAITLVIRLARDVSFLKRYMKGGHTGATVGETDTQKIIKAVVWIYSRK